MVKKGSETNMKKGFLRNFSFRERGSALVIGLIFVFVASVSIIALTRYVYETHKINERNIAREKAVLTAEAGLHLLLHYYHHPEDLAYVEDPDNNQSKIQEFFTQVGEINLSDGGSSARDVVWDTPAVGETLMTFINENLNQDLLTFNPSRDLELRVTASRPGAAAGTVFSFWSTAKSEMPSGEIVRRTSVMDIAFDITPRMISPAGIISGTTVGSSGQFNLAWGEAWGKLNIKLKLNKQAANPDPNWRAKGDGNQSADQWTKYISAEGYLVDANGTIILNNSSIYDIAVYCVSSQSGKDYTNKLYQFSNHIIPSGDPTYSQKIDGAIGQFSTLGDPTTGYEFWKQAAIRRDTYFRVSSSGAVYDSQGRQLYIDAGKLNTNNVGSALTADNAIQYYRTLTDAYVFFIDTKDGNPPATDGSNWANIDYSGSITQCSKGLIYVAGDLSLRGSGSPPGIKIENPTEITGGSARGAGAFTANVYHDGIIFTYGNYIYQGNPILYGSVIAKGYFDCGGTPNVYYNARLKTGEPYPVSTRARVLAEVIPSGVE